MVSTKAAQMRAVAVVVGVFFAAPAAADCLMRDLSPAEAAFQKRVVAALKEALPPLPPNWKNERQFESTTSQVCKGEPEGRFDIRYSASLKYTPPKEEGDRLYAEHRKLQGEIDNTSKLPPDVAKERQALLDKMSEANRAANRAEKDGDKALARQKNAEGEEYSRKAREIRGKYLASVQPALDALEARQKALEYGGAGVIVTFVANETDPKRPAGPFSEMLLGNRPTPKSPGLKVHNVRVIFEGSEAKRPMIQSLVDKGKLARVMQ